MDRDQWRDYLIGRMAVWIYKVWPSVFIRQNNEGVNSSMLGHRNRISMSRRGCVCDYVRVCVQFASFESLRFPSAYFQQWGRTPWYIWIKHSNHLTNYPPHFIQVFDLCTLQIYQTLIARFFDSIKTPKTRLIPNLSTFHTRLVHSPSETFLSNMFEISKPIKIFPFTLNSCLNEIWSYRSPKILQRCKSFQSQHHNFPLFHICCQLASLSHLSKLCFQARSRLTNSNTSVMLSTHNSWLISHFFRYWSNILIFLLCLIIHLTY